MLIQAAAQHAPVLAALHAASFAAPWQTQEFETLLRQPGVAAWIWNGESPEGFILVRAVADEAEILTIAVTPAQRRAGIASQLLTHALRILRDGATVRMFLEVAADNIAASALYTRHGFLPCGRRAGYYGAGNNATDAVVMTRDVQQTH